MRILHLSDVHIWRYTLHPVHLAGKRMQAMASLLAGRARRFRLERLDDVVERASRLDADHILITGDLTTSALPGEFEGALAALAPLLKAPERVSMVPGNHDRYTQGSVRRRLFERSFGPFMPDDHFPWIRPLGDSTAIVGLDATRAHWSARGWISARQVERAAGLLDESPGGAPDRLIVACHYPTEAPEPYAAELVHKRLENQAELRRWLSGLGPHLYCCGHVHAAWAHRPPAFPRQLCLNSGAPLLRDRTGLRLPGFLEIHLEGDGVRVDHHAWDGGGWMVVPLYEHATFFRPADEPPAAGPEGRGVEPAAGRAGA